jgi:hypothetical protein
MLTLQHITNLRAIADEHRAIGTHMMEMAVLLEYIGRPSHAQERRRIGAQHWAEATVYDEDARDMEDAWTAAQPAALHVNDTMIHRTLIHRAGFSYIFTVWNGAEWNMVDGLPHYATEAEAQEAANEYVRSLA